MSASIFPKFTSLPHARGGVSCLQVGSACREGLPHARGGVSSPEDARIARYQSSPRPWGCFHFRAVAAPHHDVFPTPVGVFPLYVPAGQLDLSLPHARGGVSVGSSGGRIIARSSPRPWGCFRAPKPTDPKTSVFPTPVGVFPEEEARDRAHLRSSPRPWGCFHFAHLPDYASGVFPTPVGVFPPPCRA